MKKRDKWYIADEGMHFVLTEKGKAEVASYKSKTVGEPVSEYDTEAIEWSVESGYEKEVPIPNWVTKPGFKVVYGDGLTVTPYVFPEIEIASKYMMNEAHRYEGVRIIPATYKGREPRECREYEGKRVHNADWYYGPSSLYVGDLVEEKIVDDMINALPPACMRSSCMQCGEAYAHRVDRRTGETKSTYITFKKVADGIYEYCGDCFRGENEMRAAN